METNNEMILNTRGLKKDALSTKAIVLLTIRRVIAYLILTILAFLSLI